MGQDKAQLRYGPMPQLLATVELLRPLVDQCHVSIRADQRDEPLRAAFPQLLDTIDDIGPAAGLLAAHAHAPEAAWLVLACDLPLLNPAVLQALIAARRPHGSAVAFASAQDGQPEPLCAIWEPVALQALQHQVGQGHYGLRSVLRAGNVQLLPLPSPDALDNANSPDDHARLLQRAGARHA